METKSKDWENAKDQVKSWIENEQHCVTTQRICQSLDISRRKASTLLKEILQDGGEFEVTSCLQQRVGNTTVFRLHKQGPSMNDVESSDSKDEMETLIALASVESTEKILTAHERDMAQWRDMISDNQTNGIGLEGRISIADEVQKSRDKSSGDSQLDNGNDNLAKESNKSAEVKISSFSKKSVIAPKAKPTTAKSFFAKHKKKQNDNVVRASANTDQGSGNESREKETKKNGRSSPDKASTMEKENKPKSENLKKKELEEKQEFNDDFVADEEESDDEENEKVIAKAKNAKRVKAAVAAARANKDDEDDDPTASEPTESVRGAMDAFAEKKDSDRKRKRRKKMVEKTTMVNGYLQTETTAIWEDIPTDEEEEEERKAKTKRSERSNSSKPVKSSAGSKVSKKQPMKQMGLMGFFKKK